MKNRKWQVIALPLIIVALSLAVYSNTLLNGFTFDDLREIVNNRLIHNFDWKEFIAAFTPGPGKSEPPGRPVPLLTFAGNYALGGLNPVGYHLGNVILHAGISLLIYLVGLELFPGRRRLSFLLAVLFGCHPIHSEIVAAAVGRAELISSLCFLAVLLVYLRKTGSDYSERSISYWMTLPVLLVGTLSKATSATLPFTAMAFDLYRFTIRRGKPLSHGVSVFTYRLKKFYWPYLVIVLVTFWLYSMMPAEEELGANFMVFLSAGGRVLAALGILARYIFLLIWPFRLSADYSYSQLSYLPEYIRNLWIGGGIVAVIAGGALTWISLRKKGQYFLAIFIFTVNYLIISNIILIINVSMAERLIYMASWGFCLALGLLLESGFTRAGRPGRVLLWTLVALLITAYSIRTWTRNRDWMDNFSLFRAAYRVCPMSCRANYNLGLEYSERGELDKAIFHYENAARIVSWNPLYRLNLGEAYAQKGEKDKALGEFREVVRLEPERAGGYINLGSAYISKGLADQAISSLMIAWELDPDDWRVYFNLGDAYLIRREISEAAEAYERSLELNPDHWQAWNKLGAMRLELRDPAKAITAFRRAIEVFPEGAPAYNNLGLAYGAIGDMRRAETAFRKALEIDPGFGKARNNLRLLLNQ